MNFCQQFHRATKQWQNCQKEQENEKIYRIQQLNIQILLFSNLVYIPLKLSLGRNDFLLLASKHKDFIYTAYKAKVHKPWSKSLAT